MTEERQLRPGRERSAEEKEKREKRFERRDGGWGGTASVFECANCGKRSRFVILAYLFAAAGWVAGAGTWRMLRCGGAPGVYESNRRLRGNEALRLEPAGATRKGFCRRYSRRQTIFRGAGREKCLSGNFDGASFSMRFLRG